MWADAMCADTMWTAAMSTAAMWTDAVRVDTVWVDAVSRAASAVADRTPPLERPPQRQLVGVLEVAAHGQPAGDARDLQPERL